MRLEATGIVGALVDAPCAWQTPAQLAAALETGLYMIAEQLCDLITQGHVDAWPDCPGGFAVTLSAPAAAGLGVTMVPTANAEVYRWSYDALSIRTRRAPTARQVGATEAHARALERVADARAEDPAEALIRAERSGRRCRGSRGKPSIDQLARPRVILWGDGLWPWSEEIRRPPPPLDCRRCTPRRRRRKGAAAIVVAACNACGKGLRRRRKLDACPGCKGRPLATWEYCLRCDRWGWDGYFARLARRSAAARAKDARRHAG